MKPMPNKAKLLLVLVLIGVIISAYSNAGKSVSLEEKSIAGILVYSIAGLTALFTFFKVSKWAPIKNSVLTVLVGLSLGIGIQPTLTNIAINIIIPS